MKPIKIKDKLPPENQEYYLFWSGRWWIGLYFKASGIYSAAFVAGKVFKIDRVTHWMLLPDNPND